MFICISFVSPESQHSLGEFHAAHTLFVLLPGQYQCVPIACQNTASYCSPTLPNLTVPHHSKGFLMPFPAFPAFPKRQNYSMPFYLLTVLLCPSPTFSLVLLHLSQGVELLATKRGGCVLSSSMLLHPSLP